MPKRSYKGDKRRREIAKKKKREEKLNRKHAPKGDSENGEDTSYLEYLHPGGLPEELQENDSEDESGEDSDDEDEDADT